MYNGTLPQSSRKLAHVHHATQNLVNCPITNTLAQGNEQATFLIPGGQARWWHCSACLGWHISIVDHEKKARAVAKPLERGADLFEF